MKTARSWSLSAIWLAAALAAAHAQTTSPEHGSLQPSSATYSVNATGGSLTIQVSRSVGSSGAVGCSYATANGSAVAGTDYVAASGTLSWAGGDASAKSVTITILNDGVASGNKSFTFRLTNPTGGAWLGVAPSSPLKNHEGRTLGTTPAVTSPTLWNIGAADSVVSTMQLLPANNPWNEDISGLPVASNSTTMVNLIGGGTNLALNRDMNYVLVPVNQTRKNVNLVDYPDESDPGPYPVPDNAPIENWPVDDNRSLADVQLDTGGQGGDRHCLVVDPAAGYVYEFWQMRRNSTFAWTASNDATFGLRTNTLRPDGWTSGDAAGLPIFFAIPRFDECDRGMVEHALRFTVQNSRNAYVYPATHMASNKTNPDYPRMGERFRLKAGVDLTGWSKHPKAIALALKKYGMFMADNGGNWRISAGSDSRLQNLPELTALKGSDFEVVVPTGPNGGPRAKSDATVTILDSGSGGSDVTPPAVTITGPTSNQTWSTSATPLSIGGTASDNVGVSSVTWTNGAGGSGTATGTTAWSAAVALSSGSNVITVTAHDAAGNSSTDTLTVTYSPADISPPVVSITTPPNATFSTATSPLAIGGTASDNVGVTSVGWSNAATSGSGTATGTTSWSASIPLMAGSNAITVTARDAAGNSSTDTVTVTYTPPAGDTTPPTVSISSPTNGTAWTATSTPLGVSGSASDNAGLSTVSWSNSAGGNGTAGGTTAWSASIPISAGTQTITITAVDTSGNTATDTLTVTYTTGGGGGGGGGPASTPSSSDEGGKKKCGLGMASPGWSSLALAFALLLPALRRRGRAAKA